MTDQQSGEVLTADAIRGFFEKHLPFDTADEWTEEIMRIVKEHRGLRRLRDAAEAVLNEWTVRGDGGCTKALQDQLREAADG